jgi:hypothetical protein
MVQADVVGHSMGGILARIYAAGDTYYKDGFYSNKNNFNTGSINKLIKLDSPHSGAFMADLTARLIKDRNSGRLSDTRSKAYNWASLWDLLNGGALQDLMTNSASLAKMRKIEILPLCHSIVGDYVVLYGIDSHGRRWYFFPDNPSGQNFTIFIEAGYDVRQYVIYNRSDLTVSVGSQSGRLAYPAISVFDHEHVEAIVNTKVSDRVIELLNEPEDSRLFSNGFPVD